MDIHLGEGTNYPHLTEDVTYVSVTYRHVDRGFTVWRRCISCEICSGGRNWAEAVPRKQADVGKHFVLS